MEPTRITTGKKSSGFWGRIGFLLFFITIVPLGLFTGLGLVAAFWEHLDKCIREEWWYFILVSVWVPPIGMVHGFGIWFDWW